MPPEHRRQVLTSVFAAVMSTVYVVTLGILLRPIPSRVIAGVMLTPNPAVSSRALPDLNPVIPVQVSARRPLRARPPRRVAAFQLAAIREAPAINSPTVSLVATRERPHNLVSRFFHGVLHAVQPGPKADVP